MPPQQAEPLHARQSGASRDLICCPGKCKPLTPRRGAVRDGPAYPGPGVVIDSGEMIQVKCDDAPGVLRGDVGWLGGRAVGRGPVDALHVAPSNLGSDVDNAGLLVL